MSYDIEICNDDGYTAHADFKQLYAFIASLPNITENGPIGFTYEAGDHYYMEIDLELVDADGNWTDNESPDTINCIRMHIPYRHMQRAYVDPARYFELRQGSWPLYSVGFMRHMRGLVPAPVARPLSVAHRLVDILARPANLLVPPACHSGAADCILYGCHA